MLTWIVPIILCGGGGTRLWPRSRPTLPKQCLALTHPEHTLVQQTMTRVQHPMFTPPILVTHAQIAPLLRTQIGEDAMMIIEPQGYNTAPAIAAAACHVRAVYGDDAVMVILPSDHAIRDEAQWMHSIHHAIEATHHHGVVLCGVVPDNPSTAYGYIQHDSTITQESLYPVVAFHEKPDAAHAYLYVNQGNYLWNSGMIIARADCLWGKMQHHVASWLPHVALAYAEAQNTHNIILLDEKYYTTVPNISFDYAILEHLHDAHVLRMDCGWSDVGTWEALWHWLPHNDHDNVVVGSITYTHCSGCYLYAEAGIELHIEDQRDQIMVITHTGILLRPRLTFP